MSRKISRSNSVVSTASNKSTYSSSSNGESCPREVIEILDAIFRKFEDAVAAEMFGIDVVLEKILDYAIYDKDGKPSLDTVKKVRLVEKRWAEATTRILRKSEEAVITLKLDETNSLVEADDVKKNGKLLDRYVVRFSALTSSLHSRLPVKLVLNLAFFRKENLESFVDFLKRCGKNLKEIEVIFPKDGGSMTFSFPPLTLPLLRKVTFQFLGSSAGHQPGDTLPRFGNNRCGICLLQVILNGCPILVPRCQGLKTLIIGSPDAFTSVPFGFESLHLPATINQLELQDQVKSEQLDELLCKRKQFPNLSKLELLIGETPFEAGLLFKILEGLQKTLKTLALNGIKTEGHYHPPTFLRFPLMKVLEIIKIGSKECELGRGIVSELQKCLPELGVLELYNQTAERLAKWTQTSRYEKVEELAVSVVNKRLNEEDESYCVSPGLEIMTQLHNSFPNIWHIVLTVNISNLTGLKCLFERMVGLKSMAITFRGNETVLDNSSDLIDSILLGLPLWIVLGLKNDMKLLETGLIAIDSCIEPSIRNLSELQTLALLTGESTGQEDGKSLISDLLFRNAFMKMTKLRTLDLFGKFKPSSVMQEEWIGQGRNITYSDA